MTFPTIFIITTFSIPRLVKEIFKKNIKNKKHPNPPFGKTRGVKIYTKRIVINSTTILLQKNFFYLL